MRKLWFFLLLALAPFSLAQTVSNYQHTSSLAGRHTSTGTWSTYRSFYNGGNTSVTYEISVQTEYCYNWDVSSTVLKTYQLGTSTSACTSASAYFHSSSVPSKRTIRTLSRDVNRYNSYLLTKTAYYTNGTSRVVDQSSALQNEQWTEFTTRLD